jgi:DNA adenine methylase
MPKPLIKSPLRYPGGKQKLVKPIFGRIPGDITEYREAFFGGGSVFFFVRQQEVARSINHWWVNDKFEPLANLWQQTALQTPLVVDMVEAFIRDAVDGRSLHKGLRKLYSQFQDPEDRAAAFFILNRCSFSGLTFSGGFSQESYDGRLTANSIRNLEKCSGLLSDVLITNLDYSELLLAPPKEEGGKVFLYLDPPYEIAASNLYGDKGNMHLHFDHARFAEDCKNCKDHRWLITYNDSEYIRSLFSWATILEFDVLYSMNSAGKKKKEILISNY